MSTLAAARADNFYYPKNYNPEKVPPKKSELTEDKPFKVDKVSELEVVRLGMKHLFMFVAKVART